MNSNNQPIQKEKKKKKLHLRSPADVIRALPRKAHTWKGRTVKFDDCDSTYTFDSMNFVAKVKARAEELKKEVKSLEDWFSVKNVMEVEVYINLSDAKEGHNGFCHLSYRKGNHAPFVSGLIRNKSGEIVPMVVAGREWKGTVTQWRAGIRIKIQK